MANLTYTEFLEELERRLEGLSVDDFKNIFLKKARKVHPDLRCEFLAQFNKSGMEDSSRLNCDAIMAELAAFIQRLEDGDYCSGWEWDPVYQEEREWGDESWAREMDRFFLLAREMLFLGETKQAEEVYSQLFSALELGREPGHLPGDPECTNMLDVDMDEHLALFCRAIYFNSPPEKRAERLFQTINEYDDFDRGLSLKEIMGAQDKRLPDFHRFLQDWLELLKDQPQSFVSSLIREAVFLQGGVNAVADLARQNPEEYPLAYLDWIAALDPDDTEGICQVAREGLAKIPRDYAVRAQVADVLAKLGGRLRDDQLQLEGCRERFISHPTLEHLVDLYLSALAVDSFEEICELAADRIRELEQAERPYSNNHERKTSSVAGDVAAHVFLLGGRYEEAVSRCEEKSSLGWSYSTNPKPVVLVFLLKLLAGRAEHTRFVEKFWERTVRVSDAYLQKYTSVMETIQEKIPISGEQEEFFLNWCIGQVKERADAIVSNKYRSSYDKAAEILVALAEVLTAKGRGGISLIEEYHLKFQRYNAFRKELRRAAAELGFVNKRK